MKYDNTTLGSWKPHENVVIETRYWENMCSEYYKIKLILSRSGINSFMGNWYLIRNFRMKYWNAPHLSKQIKCEPNMRETNMKLCEQYVQHLEDILHDPTTVDDWSALEQLKREKKFNRIKK